MNVREAFAASAWPPTDVDAIRATYKRLAKQLHPDVQGGAGGAQAAVAQGMRLINQARDLLVAASRRGRCSPRGSAAGPTSATGRRPVEADRSAVASSHHGASHRPSPGRRWDAQGGGGAVAAAGPPSP